MHATSASRHAVNDLRMTPSIHVFVDAFFDTLQDLNRRVIVEGQHLHEHDHADLLLRIDPEERVVDTSPAHAARATHVRASLGRSGDLEAEAPHVLTRAEWIWLRTQRLSRWLQAYFHGTRLVSCHVRNGLIL